MNSISVVISAYNEELKLLRCLKSVAWADEIIVVDNSSDDKTPQIAGKFGAKVFRQPNRLMLNINKNFGFDQATSDWILNLDADEEVPEALKEEILTAVEQHKIIDGYWISRQNIIFGKWITHGIWWPDKQLRLFRRGKGKFKCSRIHEYISVSGSLGDLTAPFTHYNYESVTQYLKKLDRCTTSEAQELADTGYQCVWNDAIRFPASDFIKIYFAQSGFKDGLHGLVLALLQSFYSFCVFAKSWEKLKFPERDIALEYVSDELVRTAHEVRYWDLTMQQKESKNNYLKLLLKIRSWMMKRNYNSKSG